MTDRAVVAFAGLDATHREAVRQLYESSFPLALRAPWDELTAGRADERLVVLLDESDPEAPPVGLAVVRHLGSTSLSFVRYFVVDTERRGRGHGSALCAALVDYLRDAGRSMLLLDVEDPDARPPDSLERLDDLRRIDFYRRNGVHLLAVREYSPPDHGLTGEEPRLLLMGASLHEPAEGDLPLGRAPSGAALREAVTVVYRDRYGLAADDPVVLDTLRASGL